ncbi:HTH domain-containing protein [Candidatus Woesearchaeota archaeon]|nr:MAG: hypothetical protein QS99_C0004G0053 [archaeon GW2011_AR4]MBS3129511.1 HTH domain-containing protein [Candidatus Woesearchaeota archaeon]HIH38892.1 HTH domain-containing protein [Candidatus Woesearchaeota archaeon]HIH48298.1 HTH domain-containing protein [Candidatus Woesearchaeota archaeon]HIJ03798.1 HTH domain-containing protein [Candidatus Woesearchaeota archaeon]
MFRKKSRDEQVKEAFDKIKEELTEHLDSINANTNEIQSNYEFICRLDEKIDKLAERMEEIHILLSSSRPLLDYNLDPLTDQEKKIVLLLYASTKPCTYKLLAAKLKLSEHLIRTYLTTLITKGVPIIKKYAGSEVYLSLDPDFKRLQATENILQVNEDISREIN